MDRPPDPTDDRALLSVDLPRRPESASAARKALATLNGSLHLVSAERLRDAQLLISELVANAVRHGPDARSGVSLAVRANPDVMRVEVTDDGEGFDPTRLEPPSPTRSGGYGLPIVAALAHRWGVIGAGRTTVWFEIDRPQREAPLVADPSPPESAG